MADSPSSRSFRSLPSNRHSASNEDKGSPVGMVTGMTCVRCGRTFGRLKSALSCPDCGPDGILDVQYDYELIRTVLTPVRLGQTPLRTQWRYLPLLPVRGLRRVPPLDVGWTPLYDARSLAQTVGMDHIWLKDESKNPTSSIEDRATAVAVTLALEENYSMLTCGSTGDAALSSAALTAAAGLHATLFVSREASDGYVAQLLLLGPEVFVVEGSCDDALRLSLRSAEEYGWYNRNKAINPYLIEGQKTVAYEIAEQMHWAVPDCLVVPVAEGSTIAALWKGYCEMKRLGWIGSLPRMIGVQAESAAAVYAAWKEDREPVPMRPETMAESLAVGAPHDWRKAVTAVRESGGTIVPVSDREISQAMHVLGERSGIIAEPGSAAALAALVSLLRSRQLPRTTSAVLLIASGGLRHQAAALTATGKARTLPPNFDQARVILQRPLSRTPFF